MEIESLHKYISLNKLANGTVEVMFAGQPCLVALNTPSYSYGLGESYASYAWKINPVFAKLTYGANVFEDIPVCMSSFDTVEESIADGLVKLHEAGSFNTEVDIPDDTYAATMNDIVTESKIYSVKKTNSLVEATIMHNKFMESVVAPSKSVDDEYTKWEQNVRDTHPTKKLKFKGRIENGMDTISAEEPGVDRSYGVWDNKQNKGTVFKMNEETESKEEEKKEEKAISTALKKDKKFVSKIGKGETK